MAAASAASTHQPRRLVSLWFLLSSFLVIWDTGYIFLRPRSMKGGDLHWIWAPYSLYMDIDYIYGLPSWNTHDGFPAAQSFMNIIETLLNFVYLFLVHIQNSPQSIAVAPVVGLIAAIMTLSKTVLYWLNDHFCGWCKTGHNNWSDFIYLWVIPNGAWILVPAIISVLFTIEISKNLQTAARVQGAPESARNGDEKSLKSDTHDGRLVDHDHLPQWARDNPLIRSGYRRPGGTGDESKKIYEHDSFAKCWNSIWSYWHNETVNIHTHLWGAVFSFGLASLHSLQHLSLLPSFIRPLSHHAIFYPDSLTFTTPKGKVLRLASASYPSTPEHLHFALGSQGESPGSAGLFARAYSFVSSLVSSSSSSASQHHHHYVTPGGSLSVRPPDTLDVMGFGTFFIAAMICLGFSATYHTVGCHSQHVARSFNKLDYIGIVVMIVGSFLPALHYGFYCHPEYQLLYSVGIVAMGAFAMYVVITPRYATPAYRPWRTSVFVVLGLSAVVPVAHVIQYYGYATIKTTMGLHYLVLSGALYIVGAGLYVARVPERFAPGRFDFVGSSHQIFHVLILCAAAAHYVSLRRAYGFWHTVESLGGVGREGVCLSLEAH